MAKKKKPKKVRNGLKKSQAELPTPVAPVTTRANDERRTHFENAKTPLERLHISNPHRSIEIRPCHPSEVESKISEFCKTYDLKKSDLRTEYNEGGLSLKIHW